MKTYQYKYQEGGVTVKGVIRAADSDSAIRKLKNSFDKYYPGDFQLTEIGNKCKHCNCNLVLVWLISYVIAIFMLMYINYIIT
jgi:hypothetical protein